MNRNKNNLHSTGYLPRCHWNKQHGRKRRAKRQFESIADAKQYIEKRHLINYDAYQCRVCGKYHIGHKR